MNILSFNAKKAMALMGITIFYLTINANGGNLSTNIINSTNVIETITGKKYYNTKIRVYNQYVKIYHRCGVSLYRISDIKTPLKDVFVYYEYPPMLPETQTVMNNYKQSILNKEMKFQKIASLTEKCNSFQRTIRANDTEKETCELNSDKIRMGLRSTRIAKSLTSEFCRRDGHYYYMGGSLK